MHTDTHARTQVTEVHLPAELTEPLPDDASTITVAARAAAETALGVPGVHHLGGLVARAADRVRNQLGRSATTLGVQVDDSDGTLDVVVSIVVSYPEPVHDVADEVRTQVTAAVAEVATTPVRVDVRVLDVHGPFDDEDSLVDRAADATGKAAAQVRDTATATSEKVRDVAADTADTVRRAAENTRAAAAEALEQASDKAADAADSARDAADRAKDTAADVADATVEVASDVVDHAQDAARSATDAAESAADAAAHADAADTVHRAADTARTDRP